MDVQEPTEPAGDTSKPDCKLQLQDLNFDVIYHICSYLHVMDLIACQFLSKEFCEAVTKIFERKYQHLHLHQRTFTEEQLTSTDDIVNIVTLLVQGVGQWVTTLTISPMCHFENMNQVIAEYCPQLTELDCTFPRKYKPPSAVVPFINVQILRMQHSRNTASAEPDDAIIKFYINSCPKLEKLTLSRMNVWRFDIFCGTQLKELSLNSVSETSMKPQEHLDSNTFSKLELLRIQHCGELFDVLPQLVTSGDNLKHLSLSSRSCDLARLCRSFPHLGQFEIQVDGSFSEIMNIGILSNLKRLKICFYEYQSGDQSQSDRWVNMLIQSLANRNVLQEFEILVANNSIQITVDTIEACRAFTGLKNMIIMKRTFGGRRGNDSLWSLCSAIDCLEHLQIGYQDQKWTSLQELLKDMPNLRLVRAISTNCEYLASKTVHQSIDFRQQLQIGSVEEEWASLQALVKNMPNLRSLRLSTMSDCECSCDNMAQIKINYVDFN